MGAWRVRETADLPPIPRARPVTQGVVACERLRPRLSEAVPPPGTIPMIGALSAIAGIATG